VRTQKDANKEKQTKRCQRIKRDENKEMKTKRDVNRETREQRDENKRKAIPSTQDKKEMRKRAANKEKDVKKNANKEKSNSIDWRARRTCVDAGRIQRLFVADSVDVHCATSNQLLRKREFNKLFVRLFVLTKTRTPKAKTSVLAAS
jgi:hypothetical protein